MDSTVPETPATCSVCPYRDEFHKSCRHPSRQVIIRELGHNEGDCPVFPEIRADAMSDLADSLARRDESD